MEAKELMIGDWVCENSIPHQIYELGTTFCTDRKTNLLFTDSLQPILLTLDMLIDNNFVKEGYGLAPYERSQFGKKIIIGIGESNISATPWAEPLITCKYVHELQHALRLCGLNELADNFKIK